MTHVSAIKGVKRQRAECSRVVEASRAARTNAPTTVLFPGETLSPPLPFPPSSFAIAANEKEGGVPEHIHHENLHYPANERNVRRLRNSALEFTRRNFASLYEIQAEISVKFIPINPDIYLNDLGGKEEREYTVDSKNNK